MRPRLHIFYGGSFNPVHLGHLQMAQEVIQTFKPSRFVFVPCQLWPEKGAAQVSDAQRLQMLELAREQLCGAIQARNEVDISKVEIAIDCSELERGERSYTLLSLQHFATLFPRDYRAWMIGADAWASLSQWYQWQALTDYGSLIVVRRPHVEASISAEQARWAQPKQVKAESFNEALDSGAGKITFLETSELNISSTAIREQYKRVGRCPQWLPQSVQEYIEAQKLYR